MSTVVLPAEPFKLSRGTHGSKFKGEACIKELQTIAMGERFSDKPKCISPIVDRLEIALNDRLDDKRDREKSHAEVFLKGTGTVAERKAKADLATADVGVCRGGQI